MIEARLDINKAAWDAKTSDYKTGVAEAAEAVRRASLLAVRVISSDGQVVVVRGGGNGNVG